MLPSDCVWKQLTDYPVLLLSCNLLRERDRDLSRIILAERSQYGRSILAHLRLEAQAGRVRPNEINVY